MKKVYNLGAWSVPYFIIWAASWENRIFAYAKTKAQISFAVTAKLISAFVFATRIVQFFFFLSPKFQASFCDCTGRVVLDLVGNPEDRFSRDSAHIYTLYKLYIHLHLLQASFVSKKIIKT